MTTVAAAPLVADHAAQQDWRSGHGSWSTPFSDTSNAPTATYPAVMDHRRRDYAPEPQQRPTDHGRLSSTIDQGRFWVGAVLAAGAAALTGVIAMIVANGILRVPVVFGAGDAPTVVHMTTYGLVAAAVALVVAAVYDGMLHFAPRPGVFFGWLGGLATVLAALLPLTTPAPLVSQAVLGGMNLLVGAVILVLVPAAAVTARRRA